MGWVLQNTFGMSTTSARTQSAGKSDFKCGPQRLSSSSTGSESMAITCRGMRSAKPCGYHLTSTYEACGNDCCPRLMCSQSITRDLCFELAAYDPAISANVVAELMHRVSFHKAVNLTCAVAIQSYQHRACIQGSAAWASYHHSS